MTKRRRLLLEVAAVVGLLLAGACAVPSVETAAPAGSTPAENGTLSGENCAALQGRSFGNAAMESAAVEPASDQHFDYCVVRAAFTDAALKFEARLPMSGWNGKMVMMGGGGFDGVLSPPPPYLSSSIVGDRYATLTTNGGHDANPQSPDYFAAEFAFDEQKLENFTHASEHRALAPGLALIETAYGRAPAQSYFEGCSMGGHDALMMAQRYPDDFDGIVARAPAGNIMGLFVRFHRTASAVASPAGGVSPAARQLVAEAVTARCDAMDGLEDGIVANRLACDFDPASLRCEADETEACLTNAQLQTISAIADPLSVNDNAITHPGYTIYGINEAKGWDEYIWPNPQLGGASLHRLFSDGFIRAFVTRDRGFDTSSWSPENWSEWLAKLGEDYQAFDPDLSVFADSGGKLILWNGVLDSSVSPLDTARYYEAVQETLRDEPAAQTVEYFEAPGVGHCFGGPGPDQIDLLSALDTWVETGTKASEQDLVHVSSSVDSKTARPACLYPSHPQWDGYRFACSRN